MTTFDDVLLAVVLSPIALLFIRITEAAEHYQQLMAWENEGGLSG